MSYIPDNYDKWARHDAEQEAELNKLPECCECGEKIQSEHCYEINGEYLCPVCLVDNHRKAVEDIVC